MTVGQGKCDPSRGDECGTRVAGRGGRDALRDCVDGRPWRLEPTGDELPPDTMVCSRYGRGRTPRRRRRDGCSDDRLSVGGAGPRRRSARGGLRLDNEPEPWHNSCDRLGLSELETVTRVRLWRNRALTPRLSPLLRYPNAVPTAIAGAVDADGPHGREERVHRDLGKPRRPRLPTAPTAEIFIFIKINTKRSVPGPAPTSVENPSVLDGC